MRWRWVAGLGFLSCPRLTGFLGRQVRDPFALISHFLIITARGLPIKHTVKCWRPRFLIRCSIFLTVSKLTDFFVLGLYWHCMVDGMRLHHHDEKNVYLGFHTSKIYLHCFYALTQAKLRSDQHFSNAEVSSQRQYLYFPQWLIFGYRAEGMPSSLLCSNTLDRSRTWTLYGRQMPSNFWPTKMVPFMGSKFARTVVSCPRFLVSKLCWHVVVLKEIPKCEYVQSHFIKGMTEVATRLGRYVGPKAEQLGLVAPGLKYNTGFGFKMGLEVGAATAGSFHGMHVSISHVGIGMSVR